MILRLFDDEHEIVFSRKERLASARGAWYDKALRTGLKLISEVTTKTSDRCRDSVAFDGWQKHSQVGISRKAPMGVSTWFRRTGRTVAWIALSLRCDIQEKITAA